jgi:hypothetical protein
VVTSDVGIVDTVVYSNWCGVFRFVAGEWPPATVASLVEDGCARGAASVSYPAKRTPQTAARQQITGADNRHRSESRCLQVQ